MTKLIRVALLLPVIALLVACSTESTIDQAPTPVPISTPAPAQTSVPAPEDTPTEPPATPVPTPTPTPTLLEPSVTPVPPAPTVPVVSNEVPTTQELLDIGLTEAQAECFITTIDPDETGSVQDAELFVEALSNCT